MGVALMLGMISVLIVAKGFTVLLFARWLNAILAGLAFLNAFTRLRAQ
jgi:hypothetical protein